MGYIYMDESGCLGFDFTKRKTSTHFIVTFLFVPNQNRIHKIVSKTFRSLPKREIKGHCGVLHASKAHPHTRMRLLTLLSQEKEVSIMTIRLNKRKVYTRLQDEKTVLYNYITNILLDRIITRKLIATHEPITLVASRRETNRFLNENFRNYLESQLSQKVPAINVRIAPADSEKGLQAADFASWAIFRHYEHNDPSYRDVIRALIVEDSPLF